MTAIEVRWSDLDPNFHVRHSAYYDYGASCRVQFLAAHNITAQFMQEQHFAPILFREECVFKREILLADKVTVDVKLVKARRDGSRWTLQHQVFKNDEILAAIITLDAAWLDTVKRKLTIPPPEALLAFEQTPKTADFEWV